MSTSSPLGGDSYGSSPNVHQSGQPTTPYGGPGANPYGGPGVPPGGGGVGRGLALAALIAGIVAFLLGLVPVLGIIVGLAAVVLGVLALRRRQPKAFALTGLVLGAVAVVVSLLVTLGIGALISGASREPVAEITEEVPDSPVPSVTPSDDAEPSATPTAGADPDVPADFAAALEAAKTRAVSLGSSKAVTYDSLISGGASAEAAQYAVDNVGVDWQENALKKAKSYLAGGMPIETIPDQLTSEYGEAFTQEEADYAMAHIND